MTTSRDFAADYLAAMIADRTGATLADRSAAMKEARKIERAAERAGFDLDIMAIDEQARQMVLSA